ncbi:ArsR family transcriptional regulator [Ancylomarina subtilis]|uniref:ArsR family transcriptional regulator n=1 Tax=Ancylomarina subtilis TaxID=1639035 RepID=A0A4Q7VJ40_9BACT|nr:metalloregulator ArsR/SmtB family transcription factor [Ancylomarina subtilis]RZT96173.1 ArsR family transcriptional regulator [Ancylomarina subtilis]
MKKLELFDKHQQDLAKWAKVLSHPARIAILQYLASCNTCISGDISDHLPLSRTTVSQHLKELKEIGLIKGEVEGLKMRYCLDDNAIEALNQIFSDFVTSIQPKNKEKC